jgi:Flp pilus assembly CpaF family ATPase
VEAVSFASNAPVSRYGNDEKGIMLKKHMHKMLIEEMDLKHFERDALTHPEKKQKIQEEIRGKIWKVLDSAPEAPTGRAERESLAEDVFNEATGLGALEGLLADPEITEIMVNGHKEIYIEKKGKLYLSGESFTDDATVQKAIERIVMPLGRRIDESVPYVDARLADGSRVNAIIPPLAIDGPVITIRKFSKKKLTHKDLINFGSLTEDAAAYLKNAVEARKNILIAGGTGSGKTTLLNVMSSFIPRDERIVTIEDSAELRLPQEHVVRLESRPANIEGKGEVTIRDLVKNALRMRPDRIVVGECRGGETLDMLQAMNTGHEGSMTTVHANSPRDALSRLDVLVLMSGTELPLRAIREQVRSAIDIIIQQSRMKDGSRKVTHISEITGMEGDTILMHNVFELQNGVLARAGIL